MILVDTSVWVNFFAGRHLPHVAALEQCILDNENLALCGIILAEILQGIADDTFRERDMPIPARQRSLKPWR